MTKLTDNERKLLAQASARAAECIPMRYDGVNFTAKLTIFDGTVAKLTYCSKIVDDCPMQVYSEKIMKVFTGYSWSQCFDELFEEYGGQK